ncbi:putative disease resistance protein RGA4 isoform X1 [Dendrobium catenatum]|uniref:putative disease resistance protein RGA4 isoform X1 n=1 Tax=Dendrobium catenatum TaxID=906689 RepID=UPI0009F2416B|nr:putative disease resistance protein RGA4 isoform X1 [Dendrobium catenatum]
MAEWFVGPIMEKIINTCSDYFEDYSKDYLKDQFRWQTGMKEELERLRQNHPKIQAVVFAANEAQISDQNHPINKWIWQLRDAIDEAEDVLDELEYIKHKEQLTKNTEETKKRKFTSFLFEIPRKILKIGERVIKRDPNLKRLEDAVQKLDKVSADVTTFLHLLDSAKQEQKEQEVDFFKARETGSLTTTNDLIGRGKDKESVVQWLKKLSNEHRDGNISLLSIVGHGGMGKTTLLQHVYEDEMTKEFFDLKMWVCVSNNFDVKKVIADMLSTLKKERPRLDESLDELQNSLRTEIMSKKFLLILDDIWEEDEKKQDISKWEKVFAPLAYGKIGSGILITTRMDSVAMMIAKVIKKKTEIFRLKGLEEDQCLQLLNSHAFADVENPNDYKRLRSIAGEIVKKLSGSPLAAKVIGGVLNSNLDERHWTKVLNSDFVSSKLGQNDIFLILRLSYMFLPKHLQNCFAFCSIFNQDYVFDKDDLVKMWIALGFIQQPHDQEWTMEDIGGMYFDVLVKKSLFDKFQDFEQCYKMHDLIHELAQSVSMYECLRVEDGMKLPSIIPKTLRHLSVQTINPDIIKKIGQFKYLHSLFLFDEASNQDISVLIEIFKTWRSLRLLYIHSSTGLKMIPEEIGNLIHLRYLNIRGNCSTSICGIGKLKFLQELNMFDLRDASGYRIGELENMNELCKLGINCLENVKDAEEACSAKLYAKRRLTDLTLRWSNSDSRNIDLDENVLDNLQPPKCLRNLSIKRYMGARSAIWMNNVNPIFNIEKIVLMDCLECETLPPFGQLPFLKSLELYRMPKVKWLESKFNGNDKYYAFPVLEVLRIQRLKALEDWFEAGVAAEDGCLFPCLIELELFVCPKLKELPSFPPKLKSFKINDNIALTTLDFCSNSNPIPLQSLEVFDCPNITSLPPADEITRLAALRSLTISLKDCLEWETLPPFGQLPFLKSLTLSNMPKVKWLESKFNGNDKYRAFPLLEVLQIYRLEALEDWFEAGVAAEDGCFFPCLIHLELDNCSKLKELPSLPPKLKSLWIENIGWTTLNFCSNSNPIPLQTLKVSRCPNITSLPLADEIARLAALRYLRIIKCPNLISLGRYREVESTNNCHLMLSYLGISDPSVLLIEPLRSIASLKELSIWGNDELVSFPNEVVSLLESLSSLEKLSISNVPMLRELPNLPPSLITLRIWGECHPELKERYREDGGSDRHKIAHIPYFYIWTL